jgi:hypothetical protein
MVYFQTKNPNLGKFWRGLEWKMLAYTISILNICIRAIWYILWPLGNLVAIWYISPPFWYIVSRKIWQPWRERPDSYRWSV